MASFGRFGARTVVLKVTDQLAVSVATRLVYLRMPAGSLDTSLTLQML